jgi:hypothetical protein
MSLLILLVERLQPIGRSWLGVRDPLCEHLTSDALKKNQNQINGFLVAAEFLADPTEISTWNCGVDGHIGGSWDAVEL